MEFDQATLKQEIEATCQICGQESTIQRVIVTIEPDPDSRENAMGHPRTNLGTAYPVCTPCANSPLWRIARLDTGAAAPGTPPETSPVQS